MAQSLELPLPEITTNDFTRAWSRFELVATAKEWDAAKQLAYLPTLLRGKLIDIYLELDDASKADMKTLKAALSEKSGLTKDYLSAAKAFMERTQGPDEKVADYASQLKKLFREGHSDEDLTSKVLLQRFITGLRAPVSQQLLLKNSKPASLDEALKIAGEVEFVLNLEKQPLQATSAINAVKTQEEQRLDSLQQAVVQMTKKLETLEAKLSQAPARRTSEIAESKPDPGRSASSSGFGPRARFPRRRWQDDKPCFLCGEFGHWRRECPLNSNKPAREVAGGWQGNN